MKNRYLKKHLILAIGALLLIMPFPAKAGQTRQYKIEAAFLFHFFNYITWPGYKSPEGLKNATICIFDNDAVTPYLDYIKRKKAHERQLNIRKLQKEDSITGCNLLFTRGSATSTANVPNNVLIVNGSDGHKTDNTMIELTRDNERMAMKINYSLLEEHGFQISSRLLSLAEGIE